MTSAFKSVVDSTYDSIEGYRHAIEKVDDPQIKSVLEERLERREATLTRLNAELVRQGEDLITKGTATGTLHQLWLEVASLIEGGDRSAIERVKEGEAYLGAKYRKALESDSLDPDEASTLRDVLPEVEEGERFASLAEMAYE